MEWRSYPKQLMNLVMFCQSMMQLFKMKPHGLGLQLACSLQMLYIVASTLGRVKAKSMKLVFVISPLNTQYERGEAKTVVSSESE